ncbi:MAG: RagB/SusD family nutrient uptake outer membrane protein [Cyclobacteriaceae bacterium]
MKNIILITILAFSVSCSGFLEEDLSTLITSESGALKNESGLTAALAGTYKPLTATWQSGLGNASTQAILMGADDLTTHKASNKADFREFDQFKVSQQNGRLPFVWSGAYKSIQGSNNIIANYEGAIGDPAVINQIAGEAYFLRAYNYFWIVKLWGKAPLVLETHTFDPTILEISSSEPQVIYDQILSDLDAAIGLLSDAKPAPGRANKGSALAVKAQVYLQMAGWPLKQTDKYAMAASTAKELIDNEATYGFGLMDDFADLWPSPTINNDGNKEEVFALNFFAGQWWNGNAVYGLPARPGEDSGWDDYFSELTFFNNFPDQRRKDFTFQTESGATPWQNFATARPYFQKLQGDRADWLNALSLPLIRMAEVYFIFAEAQIVSTGNNADPDALEALNKIVRRAYGLPLDTPDAGVDYTSATQQDVIQEKAWEFAGEYCRWFDLTRLEMVESVTATKDPNDLQPLGTIEYYLPLPASEVLTNPGLGED